MTGDKVKLEQTIYYIYDDQIIKDYVYAIGKDSFIISSFQDDAVDPESVEWFFEDYGTKWFTNLKVAKEYVKQYVKDHFGPNVRVKFVKYDKFDSSIYDIVLKER